MLKVGLFSLCVCSSSLFASVPIVDAISETTPIPFGDSDSDDAAVWVNKDDPEKSLILGVSKYDGDPANPGGVGVYSLNGTEKNFMPIGKINNIDVVYDVEIDDDDYDVAFATNRTTNSIEYFEIDDGEVNHMHTLPITDAKGTSIEPYGLCAAEIDGQAIVFVTSKAGVLYRFTQKDDELDLELDGTWDLSTHVSASDELLIRNVVYKEVRYEDELDELEEELEERYTLEGCVVDPDYREIYVGMENLGIWRISLNDSVFSDPELLWKITGSWTDISDWWNPQTLRMTDDIEGLSLFRKSATEGYIVASVQGISEFLVFDRRTLRPMGSFQLKYRTDDVTKTDGIHVQAGYFGERFKQGIVVVHDDENTDSDGQILNGNYKIASWDQIAAALGF